MDDTCNAKWLGFSSTVSTSLYENNAFHSYGMPLSSDASLCIMENPSRSQHSQDSSPKLENLLGNATMGSHYENYESEAMALSLDSIYYQQNVDDQETQRQQEEEAHMQYFSGMPCYEMYQTSPIRENVDYLTDDLFSGNFNGQEVGNSTMIHDHGSNAPVSASVESKGYGDLQCLSLSMSPGSQSSSITPSRQISPTETHCLAIETKKRGPAKIGTKHRKSINTFGQRTSQYRGVTRHRWTGRYEAHLWDNSSTKEGQTRKGRQVYLGGYDVEEKAAIAYDCAALKYWGSGTRINFPLENYQQQLEDMKSLNRQEYVAHLRRRSSGFSRGASIYRGVTKHHQQGRWQARIGRVSGNKDLYLGTFSTQEDAAEAYDIAAIKFRGANSITNFEMTKYDVEKIMASDTLLAGEQARRIHDIQPRLTNAIVEYMIPSSVAPSHDDRSSSDWKVMLNQFPDQQQQNVEPVAEKAIFMGHEQAQKHYKNLSFSVALEDIIGDETLISTQLMLDDSSSTKIDNGHHFSDPSSLVTSLSSSREASPDKPDVAASMLLLRQLM